MHFLLDVNLVTAAVSGHCAHLVIPISFCFQEIQVSLQEHNIGKY
jgi:hypothetical protein